MYGYFHNNTLINFGDKRASTNLYAYQESETYIKKSYFLVYFIYLKKFLKFLQKNYYESLKMEKGSPCILISGANSKFIIIILIFHNKWFLFSSLFIIDSVFKENVCKYFANVMSINGQTLIIVASVFLRNHETSDDLLKGITGTIEFTDGLVAIFSKSYLEDNLKNMGAIYISFSSLYMRLSKIKIIQCTFLNQSSIMGSSITIINFSKTNILIYNNSFFLNVAEQSNIFFL